MRYWIFKNIQVDYYSRIDNKKNIFYCKVNLTNFSLQQLIQMQIKQRTVLLINEVGRIIS